MGHLSVWIWNIVYFESCNTYAILYIHTQLVIVNLAEEMLPVFCFWCLACDLNPSFTYNKSTHYLLDYGNCDSMLSQNSVYYIHWKQWTALRLRNVGIYWANEKLMNVVNIAKEKKTKKSIFSVEVEFVMFRVQQTNMWSNRS